MNLNPEVRFAGILGFIGSLLALDTAPLSIILALLRLYYTNTSSVHLLLDDISLGLQILWVVGIILIFIALNRLSNIYGRPGIFVNAIKALIFIIAVTVITVVTTIAAISFSSGPLLAVVILAFLASFYALLIMYGKYMRNSLYELHSVSNIEHFRKAGTWIWYGSILIIAYGAGIILILIGYIYTTLGFNKLKSTT